MGIVIETEKLLLSVFKEEDVASARRFWGDSEVMEQSGGPLALDLLPKVLESYAKCHEKNGLSMYAVTEKSSGEIIGSAGFNVRESVEKIELVYHFSKRSWGKGYATEAAKACIQLAKQNPSVKLLYASANPENAASVKILDKLGFEFIEMRWFDDTNQNEPYYEYHLF